MATGRPIRKGKGNEAFGTASRTLNDSFALQEEQMSVSRNKRGRTSNIAASRRAYKPDTTTQQNQRGRQRGTPLKGDNIEQVAPSQPLRSSAKQRKQSQRERDRTPPRVRSQSQKSLENPARSKPKSRNHSVQSTHQDAARKVGGLKRKRGLKEEAGGALDYQHLLAVERKVPRQTIDSKWEPLPPNAIEHVTQLLGDVEKSVVMRLRDERKRTQAATSISMVARRLQRKLVRGLPFPPSTRSRKEEDFDFEKILDSNVTLETQLTPMLHSTELLKAEIKRENLQLDEEVRNLDTLETNAKADAARRKKDSKHNHSLYTEADARVEGLGDAIGLANRRSGPQEIGEIHGDIPFNVILDQLNNHLESVRTNHLQVEGLVWEMETSRTALDDIVYTHVDMKRYGHVVLG
ncbi:MAG: hypothetical protein M1818_005097 [Claussenomyces sp. TS43310]|nr:MAG: hypothetical protein M1818_005097 [Claussenomyces sp. TS43310]